MFNKQLIINMVFDELKSNQPLRKEFAQIMKQEIKETLTNEK